MATVTTKPITAEEFYLFTHRPENRDRVFELERGEIVEMSRPGKKHGMVCANATGIMRNFAIARKKGYPCSNDTGVIVDRDPDTVRGPDVLFFEDASHADEVEEGYGTVAPLVAIEVLSPNDSVTKLLKRIKEQLSFGTKLVWVLDPEDRTVIVFRQGREDIVLSEEQELTGEDVLPDFRCLVAEFFRLPGE